MIQSYKDLQVFQLSYELAMELFWLTKKFPKEELYETKVWLCFATDCKYLTGDEHQALTGRYEELGKMLHRLFENWKTYTVEKPS